MAQHFDPAAATAAYLAQLPPEAHVKAQHYTQGGHWLLLWSFVVSVVAAWIIIRTGVLTRVEQGIERKKGRPFLASVVVAAVYVASAACWNCPGRPMPAGGGRSSTA
jgi:STE24 endopeptidase